MPDKAFRLLRMLQLIPRHPKQISTTQLAEKLRGSDDLSIPSIRTIQRDLNSLEAQCRGLTARQAGNTQEWYWDTSAFFSAPPMDAHEAVALDMAGRFLAPLLPKPVVERLAPYVAFADQVLKEAERGRRGPRWRDKVRVVPPTQPIQPPQIDPDVFRTVLDALFHDWQITFTYCNAKREIKHHDHCSPLALVYWGEIAFLLASRDGSDKVLQYALHRIQNVEGLSGQRVRRPDAFDIDRWIREGNLSIRRGAPIVLEAWFHGPRSRRFAQTPLSDNQEILNDDDEHVHLRATVNDTEELRWWLLGFGPDVEVLAPPGLRQDLAEKIAAMQALYSRTTPRGPPAIGGQTGWGG